MTTVDMTLGTSTGKHAANYGKKVKTLYTIIDLPKVYTANSSTVLAVSDIIKALRIPAGSQLLDVGARTLEAADVSKFSFSLGDSTGAAIFVAAKGVDAVAGSYAPQAWTFNGTYVMVASNGLSTYAVPVNTLAFPFVRYRSADDVRLTVNSYLGTVPTTGQIGVWAVVAPISPFEGANINDTGSAGEPQA